MLETQSTSHNGSYTKLPNVTFELFDIIDLLDSERAFFVWYYSEYHYRTPFVGSIRELATLARRSKSATDRIVKRLVDAGFLRTYADGGHTTVEIEIAALWEWNKVASPMHTRQKAHQNNLVKSTETHLTELRSMSYASYLQTTEWQNKRQKALRFAGFRCQLCNSKERLNVHHRTYERLGREMMGDLFTLCNDCHAIFHNNGQIAKGEK